MRIAHAPGTLSPPHRLETKPLVSDLSKRDARAVMLVGIVDRWRRGKRYRHSRRTRSLQFNVSGKRPMLVKGAPGTG